MLSRLVRIFPLVALSLTFGTTCIAGNSEHSSVNVLAGSMIAVGKLLASPPLEPHTPLGMPIDYEEFLIADQWQIAKDANILVSKKNNKEWFVLTLPKRTVLFKGEGNLCGSKFSLSPNGKLIACSSANKLRFVSTVSGEVIAELQIPELLEVAGWFPHLNAVFVRNFRGGKILDLSRDTFEDYVLGGQVWWSESVYQNGAIQWAGNSRKMVMLELSRTTEGKFQAKVLSEVEFARPSDGKPMFMKSGRYVYYPSVGMNLHWLDLTSGAGGEYRLANVGDRFIKLNEDALLITPGHGNPPFSSYVLDISSQTMSLVIDGLKAYPPDRINGERNGFTLYQAFSGKSKSQLLIGDQVNTEPSKSAAEVIASADAARSLKESKKIEPGGIMLYPKAAIGLTVWAVCVFLPDACRNR